MSRAAVEALFPALEPYAEWLTVRSTMPSEGVWADAAQVGDPAAGHVDRLLAARSTDPRRVARLVARDAIGDLAFCLVTPQVMALSTQRRLPAVAPGDVKVRLDGPADMGDVVWDTERVIVLAGDPLAGDPDAVVVTDEAVLVETLVSWSVEVMGPVIDLVCSRIRLGRRGAWGIVLDCLADIGPDVLDADPASGLARLQHLRSAASGTPLDQAVPTLKVLWSGGERIQVGRSSCCLYYQAPPEPDDEMPEWLRGPWERYCTTCPLLPADEAHRRLVRRVEEDQREKETV